MDAEFAAAMARLGPWDAARRVAVAVSGGADSLALALLTQGWGDPVAFVVDHGLRDTSAAEAKATRSMLVARGVPARVLRLDDLRPGPSIAARARAARYAALNAACREAGLVDLLIGHHAGDQAETVLMRQRRGSGLHGLAGMAALATSEDVRVLRPLLGIDPARLRALVASAGLTPIDDPTNTDLRTTRARLRQEIGTDRAGLLAVAAQAGQARAAQERDVAQDLAARAQIRPERFAVLSPGPVHVQSLAALIRSLSGRPFPVDAGRLAACPRAATVAGVAMQAAGRLGPGWLLTREAAAIATAAPATVGAVWDGRFRVVTGSGVVGALGVAASQFRRLSHLPFAVLRTLPAFRRNSVLSDVPDLDYHVGQAPWGRGVVRHAGLPAAGAPFVSS